MGLHSKNFFFFLIFFFFKKGNQTKIILNENRIFLQMLVITFNSTSSLRFNQHHHYLRQSSKNSTSRTQGIVIILKLQRIFYMSMKVAFVIYKPLQGPKEHLPFWGSYKNYFHIICRLRNALIYKKVIHRVSIEITNAYFDLRLHNKYVLVQ